MRKGFLEEIQEKNRRRSMKKGLWKRRAFAFLVAAAMVIPQGVYAAETEGKLPQRFSLAKREVPSRRKVAVR